MYGSRAGRWPPQDLRACRRIDSNTDAAARRRQHPPAQQRRREEDGRQDRPERGPAGRTDPERPGGDAGARAGGADTARAGFILSRTRDLSMCAERHLMRRIVLLAAFLALVLSARTSSAQNAGLSGFLLRFFAPSNPVILADTGHAAHFGSQPGAQATLTQLNRGIASQLATFPLGSSSGGFSTLRPRARRLHPNRTLRALFAERALTAGKASSAWARTTCTTFDSFEGENLRDGDITLFLTHADLNRDGGHRLLSWATPSRRTSSRRSRHGRARQLRVTDRLTWVWSALPRHPDGRAHPRAHEKFSTETSPSSSTLPERDGRQRHPRLRRGPGLGDPCCASSTGSRPSREAAWPRAST
jgi:hypothetical protein